MKLKVLILGLSNCVEVLAEAVHLIQVVLGREIKNELDGHVFKHIDLILFAVTPHNLIKLVLLGQQPVERQMISKFLLAMSTQLLKVDEPGDGCPFKVKQGQMLLL